MLIIKKLYHCFKEFISPKYCFHCLKYNNNYLCQECLKRLNFELGIFCFECGKRLPNFTKCHSSTLKYLISFASYENQTLSKMIIQGKSEGYFEIFKDLGNYISQDLKKLGFQGYYLAFVPLYYRKLLKRGFNQAEVLAKTISKNLNLPLYDGLLKIKETKDQANLSYEERLTNLKNAFALKNKPPEKIILVDDVKTTGSTLKECAQALKKAGAKKIIALTVLK